MVEIPRKKGVKERNVQRMKGSRFGELEKYIQHTLWVTFVIVKLFVTQPQGSMKDIKDAICKF